MKIAGDLKKISFELLFFEHRYLVYYSRFRYDILGSHLKHFS